MNTVRKDLENGAVVQITKIGDSVLFQGFRPSEDGVGVKAINFSAEATIGIRDALNEMFPIEDGEKGGAA